MSNFKTNIRLFRILIIDIHLKAPKFIILLLSIVIYLCLIIFLLDHLIASFIALYEAKSSWKIPFFNIAILILNLVSCLVMKLRKKEVYHFLKLIREDTKSDKSKYIIASFWAFALICPALHFRHLETKSIYFYTYSLSFLSQTIKLILAYIKFFLLSYFIPNSQILFAFLYCRICNTFSTHIKHLSDKMDSGEIGINTKSSQVDILQKKSQIVTLMKQTNDLFSFPVFLVCISNFLVCFTFVGIAGNDKFLYFSSLRTLGNVITVSSSFSILFAIIWAGSQVKIEMDSFIFTMWRQLERNSLAGSPVESNNLVKEFIKMPNVELSACNTMYFKRSNIIAIAGTILTYSLIIMSTTAT